MNAALNARSRLAQRRERMVGHRAVEHYFPEKQDDCLPFFIPCGVHDVHLSSPFMRMEWRLPCPCGTRTDVPLEALQDGKALICGHCGEPLPYEAGDLREAGGPRCNLMHRYSPD